MATDDSFHTSPSLVQEAHATQDKELSDFRYVFFPHLPLKCLSILQCSQNKGKAEMFLKVESRIYGNSRQESYLTPHYPANE